MAEQTLVRVAHDSEDVAGALRVFRDALPDDATQITAIISKLFGISALLIRLNDAYQHPRYAPSFYRIKQDIKVVLISLQATHDAAFDMFGRTKNLSRGMVWGDLRHRMERDEGVSFLERLAWYEGLLRCCIDILKEYRPDDLLHLREDILQLLRMQHSFSQRSREPGLPRPQPQRHGSLKYPDMPTSPSSASDDWDGGRPAFPYAPEPPLSPTYTTSSSHTLDSSHTSYSSGALLPQSAGVHWCRSIFDGAYPVTLFKGAHQLPGRSVCYGHQHNDALHRLRDDGFMRALEIPFDNESIWIRFYCRPSDGRVRILFMTSQNKYCVPLTTLIAIRKKSSIALCRVKDNGDYILWASLNFAVYERMVLFYATFVAMKRQDTMEKIPKQLIEDHNSLREEHLYCGVIQHEDMLHALRLFKDHTSGVIRLEASALRGPRRDVTIWTAFITKYAHDQDWLALEDGGLVTLAALKPPPYVFLADYHPARLGEEYALHFENVKDAQGFVQTWAGLCRSMS